MFAEEPVPDWLVTIVSDVLPFREFTTGFLVVLGIFLGSVPPSGW